MLDDLKWVQGENELKTFIAENGTRRKLCRHCGSSMTFKSPEYQAKSIEIALATLDGDIDDSLKPDAHIYVKYKASWDDICSTLTIAIAVSCRMNKYDLLLNF